MNCLRKSSQLKAHKGLLGETHSYMEFGSPGVNPGPKVNVVPPGKPPELKPPGTPLAPPAPGGGGAPFNPSSPN